MIIYHLFFFASQFFHFFRLPVMVAYLTGFLFIFTSGLAIYYSWSNLTKEELLQKAMKRFLRLGFFALLISIASFFYSQRCYVKFGILHFFATATPLIMLWFISPFYYFLALLLLQTLPFFFPTFDFLFGKTNFCSLDYYPLFPWIFVYTLSLILAPTILSKLVDLKVPKRLDWLTILGKYSLEIYFLHLLFIIALFSLLKHILLQFS